MFILTQKTTGLQKKTNSLKGALKILTALSQFNNLKKLKEFYKIEDLIDNDDND